MVAAMRYEAGDSVNGYYDEIAGLFHNCIIDVTSGPD